MKSFYKILFLLVTLFTSQLSFSQVDTANMEVGVIEHLDKNVAMNAVFTNDKGTQVKLSDIITKPTVLSLVYFDCPGICSPLLDGVSDAIEKCGLELGSEYQVLTISFNYKDTPEKAAKKKQNFLKKHSKSHADNWIYLTGDSANIYKVANSIGYKFKPQGNDFMHPGVITFLSPKGKITRYLYGIQYLPFDFKMAVIEAQKGISRPSVNKILDYCFNYDVAGRRYTLNVTRVTATVIIFFALVLLIILLIKGRKKK